MENQNKSDEDTVVISGMSAKVSNSDNLAEFKHQLYSGDDMVKKNTRFAIQPNIPERFGAIPTINKFDFEFFGIHSNHVDITDAASRIILEIVCEALWDAGIALEEMKGARAAIFMGYNFSDHEVKCTDYSFPDKHQLIGMTRLAFVDKISYFLGINGPKVLVDNACSTSMYALDHAFKSLKSGDVDYAIVCALTIILSSSLTDQYAKLGLLSEDGVCKSFDNAANGYVRSESVQAIILQRLPDARRNYADVIGVLTNCNGYKEEGIVHPSAESQIQLLKDFYAMYNVLPESIGFFEAHGTGTATGDKQELLAIGDFFCTKRKDPLLIGAVKSNLGHTECAAGLNAVSKCVWILESNKIASNIHYQNANTNCKYLEDGHLQVVTEEMDLPKDKPYVALNCFGFGGTNVHVVLKKPQANPKMLDNNDTRLVLINGRTHDSVKTIYDDLKSRAFDPDFIALLNSGLGRRTDRMHCKGYCIADMNGVSPMKYSQSKEGSLPLTFLFGNDGVVALIPSLMKLLPFEQHVQKIKQLFLKENISWSLSNTCEIIATITVQTGIIELLKVIITEDVINYIGFGLGALSAAYAKNILSLEQILMLANEISSKMSNKNDFCIKSTMIEKKIQVILNNSSLPTLRKQENGSIEMNCSDGFSDVLPEDRLLKMKKQNVLIIGNMSSQQKSQLAKTITISDHCEQQFSFLNAMGQLHLLSYDININNIYPLPWPVNSQTPMINSLVKWDHKRSWSYILEWKPKENKCYIINKYSNQHWQYIDGHNIDGKLLFPASGYLRLVWECLRKESQEPFKFEDVCFHHACTLLPDQNLQLVVHWHMCSGKFEIMERDSTVASGILKELKNFDEEWVELPPLPHPGMENMMENRDICKELSLRGYNYSGQYNEISRCDISAFVAEIKWTEWCPFLENLLHVIALGIDTRNTLVATKIRQVIIHPKKHFDVIFSSGRTKDMLLPVYHYKLFNILRCGYVEIRGLETASIPQQKFKEPVLEVYQFVPYKDKLDLATATRVLIQIALENCQDVKPKIIEYYNDIICSRVPLLPYIQKAVLSQPLIQPEFTLYSKKQLDLAQDVPTVNNDIPRNYSNLVAIGFNLSKDIILQKTLLKSIKDDGFLISREDLNTEQYDNNFRVICEYSTPSEKLIMLKPIKEVKLGLPIEITGDDFQWIEDIKDAKRKKQNILVYSENYANNGLLGFTNCLSKELGENAILTVIIDDTASPKFDINHKLYRKQLQKNLIINILRNGVWGSYRYLALNPNRLVGTTHFHAECTVEHNMRSITWVQGPLSAAESNNMNKKLDTVHIYSTGLNFRDVLFYNGKIHSDYSRGNSLHQNIGFGFECAGRRENGKRVMSLGLSPMLSNMVSVESNLIWAIPDNWTMEEAATVPFVYMTLIYGLLVRGQLQPGESILIHSATSGIGLAAINIALYYKCRIFLTVVSSKQQEYILENYPSISGSCIGYSRDSSFYEIIKKKNNGKGVDVILSSWLEDELLSVNCLARGGRFIESGNYDCMKNTSLRVEFASKEVEYHGVMLEDILENSKRNILKDISSIFLEGIKEGFVKPIPRVVVAKNEMEKTLKLMTTGNYIGKVIVKIRNEEPQKSVIPITLMGKVRPKFYCKPFGIYIIVGGLGGFGLELIDWLISRGAKKILIVSRRGITSGYQRFRMKIWASYSCNIEVSTEDCSNLDGCTALLQKALKMGEVVGIFNLAGILRDAVFENQTPEIFLESYKPKALIAMYLDQLSRKMCPKLSHFVVFSSFSCGRGNAAQTNYGYSNSAMERICENRKKSGLPGKAIQWCAIADVGFALNFKGEDMILTGAEPMRVGHCLENLDVLLTCDETVVSCMVVKKQDSSQRADINTAISNIFQIKDLKTVSPHTAFPEFGMDSSMVIEIKQILEGTFGIFITSQELHSMTFAKLAKLVSNRKGMEN